jgi:hypothetical protein
VRIRPLAVGLLALAGCGRAPAAPTQGTLFTSLPAESTGVAFVNRLPEDSAFNILNYLYYYNGGGVAAGDVDGDGLPDLYFTSNLGSNKLYKNLGNFRFEDVTARAGVEDSIGWKTGITMADVNGDGRLDLYVSAVSYLTMQGRNVLYINEGDGTFSDRTQEYGLAFTGYSTQSLFFDYDGDGDLDMYLLNHSTHTERAIAPSTSRQVRSPKAGDRLYRNDRNRFVDVSAAARIYGGVEGFGLGVVASDVDLNGCPDLYIANDFPENDFLYLNNCDGTFTESITRATGHTSRFSMGVDAADFNNDGRPDLVVLDMLPDREEILKTSANAESFNVFELKLKAGYHPQYARNTLQLNRGNARFSDIGYFAGVFATDWSWAPLFADFDNDGRKDLFITNGIFRRPNDLDYINYVGHEAKQQSDRAVLTRMPQVPLANYAFHNNGDLTFADSAETWGLGQPGFSSGAAYVDLNDDGALDLVVSNVNAPAAIYANRARSVGSNHFLQLRLRGSAQNTAGIGTNVTIVADGKRQLLEQMPTRGFQSSVDPRLHFGLGGASQVDSLIVVWPDRRFQVLTGIDADRTLTLSHQDATGRYAYRSADAEPLFTDVTRSVSLPYRHQENTFFDYDREPLMPHLLSTQGPALAVGDVNGDGLDDVYVGGAKWQPAAMFVQQSDGDFRRVYMSAFRADSLSEDVDAAFFDADGDSDLDLYVVSGGNESWGESDPARDRLYVNDGRGNFRRDWHALPDFFHTGSCVAPGDFNGDGHVDLFVGSRVVPRQYGAPPRSYLLQNDGRGGFRDVTDQVAPGLAHAGMVSSATWIGRDLFVVGEWMPVRVFRQQNGKFVDFTAQTKLADAAGWWNSIHAADLNGDARPDLVLGNLGLNSYIRASAAEPARLYVHDFFQNGTLEQILTFYKHGVSYPLAGRDDLVRLMPQLRSRYTSYAAFGASRIENILSAADIRQAQVLDATTFASAVALNVGDGTFALRPLPSEAQFAPIYATLADDFDGDGDVDLIAAGNFFGVTPVQGRYDASYGLLLRGDGKGTFAAVDMQSSGLEIDGQVRRMALLKRANGERVILVARNNDSLQIIRPLRYRPRDEGAISKR